MNRKLFRAGAFLGAVATVAGMAAPAMATVTAPTNSTGFDNHPDVILTGGSDTTFYVTNLFTGMYNQSQGCTTNNTVAPFDDCAPLVDGLNQVGPTGAFANWDHDVVANSFPYGSGSGRNALANSALVLNNLDLGRSSSGIGTTAAVNSLYEFASEGLAVVAVNPALRARTTGTLDFTQAQLQAIYEKAGTVGVCDSTVTWGDLGDTGVNAADLVLPFGMNTGSGTFGSFNTFVGGNASTGDCVLGQPFENDVANLGITNPTATAAQMIARRDSGQGIWWMSGATLTAFPVQSAGLSALAFNTAIPPAHGPDVSYTATTGYPLRRNVSFVARDTDAFWCTAATAPAAGTVGTFCSGPSTLGWQQDLTATPTVDKTGGKAGAVREFVRWVCRTNNQLADPNTQTSATPIGFVAQISGAIQKAGFSTSVGGTNAAFGRCKAST